jgi:hypothetical protein
MGNFAESLDGGGGDEGHIGELDAVLLLEAGLLTLAQADNAGHVHLVDGVDVRADLHALHHALGDDGAHLGERHHLWPMTLAALAAGQLRLLRRGGAFRL